MLEIKNNKISQKNREKIVKAAVKLFSKKGYHNTTMREISKLSEINLSQLYTYINTKNDILFLFYKSLYDKLYHSSKELENYRNDNQTEKLVYLIKTQSKVIQDYKSEFITMYTESRHLEKKSLKIVMNMENYLIKKMKKIITQGIKEKEFKNCDATWTANIIAYLLMFEPLRGWNLRDKYTESDRLNNIISLICSMLSVEKIPKV